MTATQTSMLPLTTVFTPPVTCLQSTRTSNGSLFLGPSGTSDCLPPGWRPNSWYSPGICPNGYALATREPYLRGNVTESQGVCCPNGFWVTETTPTTHLCTSGASNGWVNEVLTASAVRIRWREYIDPGSSLSSKEPKADARLTPLFVGVALLATLALLTFAVIRFILPTFHNATRAKYGLLDESTSDEGTHREKKIVHPGSITRDSWFYEIIAIALSVFCLSAMGLVLWSYDGQITPEFAYGFTLNTAISLLSVTTKALLMFTVGECIGQLRWVRLKDVSNPISNIQDYDNASRGPWGSVLMIAQDQGKSLVTIAAFTTVLVLAFDPFVQQVLTYPVRNTVIESSDARTRQSRSVNFQNKNTAMSQIANSAIWTDLSGLDVICPTGNCSWPLFQSVEMCSRCEDITSHAVLVGCDLAPLNSSIPGYNQKASCNISIPHGRWSSIPISPVSSKSLEYGSLQPYSTSWEFDSPFALSMPEIIVWEIETVDGTLSPFSASPFPKESFLGRINPLYVLAHARLDLPGDGWSSSTSPPTEGLHIKNVTQCAMAFCLRTYEVFVSYGQISTIVKGEEFGTLYNPKLAPTNMTIPTCWKANMSIKEPMDTISQAQNISHDLEDWTDSSGFGFCWSPDYYGFEQFPDLSGQVMRIYTGDPLTSTSWEWLLTQRAEGFNRDLMLWVNHFGLETVMNRVAHSLSKFARDNSDYTVSGRMAVSKSFVQVSWLWLIFPTALVVLTIILLGSTIFIANTKQVSLWKTSLLPLIFNAPGGAVGMADEPSLLSEMEQVAKTIHLRLEDSSTERRQVLRRKSL